MNLFQSVVKIIDQEVLLLYLDTTENYTYDQRGSQRVVANTSGSEKTRLTIGIGGSADGTKLPLVIIVPRKKPLRNFVVPSNIIIVYKTPATFDAETVKTEFIQRVLLAHLIKRSQKNPILYFDQAPCHKSPIVTKFMKDLNIKYSFIPPRLTGLLQPADVSWLKSFKKLYVEKWTDWFLNDPKSLTRNGNIKSPGYHKAIEWLSEIWTEFNR